MNQREETLTVVKCKGNVVWYRWVRRYAYPKNGNVHNPTPEYCFERWEDGKFVDQSGRLKDLLP
jgi:hypothetical protein